MRFFPEEPVPAAPQVRPEREPEPPWTAPPIGEVPAALPVSALLASSQHVAVVLRSVRIYSNGIDFEIQGKLRRADTSDDVWDDLQSRFHEYGRVGRRNTGRLRVGVLLPDGSHAISATRHRDSEDDTEVDTYRLTRQGGGGTGSDTFQDMDWSFWLWPLPPDGPITVVSDWPALELPESRFEFDGTTSDAAARVVTIWPDQDNVPANPQPSWTISAWRDACNDLAIRPKFTRPRRPQTNGKIERFHRTLADGWASPVTTTANQPAEQPSRPGCTPTTTTAPTPRSAAIHPSAD